MSANGGQGKLMRLEKLPAEVWLRLGRRRKDLWRLAVYAKSQCSCAHAWGETLAYGRKIGVKDEPKGKGWNKHDTGGSHESR